jgi:hypothetical protein
MVDMTNWFHGFYKPTYNCGAPSCIPISDEILLSHLAAGCFPGGKSFLTGFLDGVMNEVKRVGKLCPVVSMKTYEQCSEPLLVDDYRGLYHPIYW